MRALLGNVKQGCTGPGGCRPKLPSSKETFIRSASCCCCHLLSFTFSLAVHCLVACCHSIATLALVGVSSSCLLQRGPSQGLPSAAAFLCFPFILVCCPSPSHSPSLALFAVTLLLHWPWRVQPQAAFRDISLRPALCCCCHLLLIMPICTSMVGIYITDASPA